MRVKAGNFAMTRTHLERLTIIVVIAAVIGLAIIGLILIARIPPYYLAVLVGLMFYIGVPVFLVVIPAIGVMISIISTLVGGVTIGWAVRRFMDTKGCLIATIAGVVSGGSFIILVGILNLVAATFL